MLTQYKLIDTINKNITYEKEKQIKNKGEKAITLIALVITILFSYDEKLKCSSSKGFLPATI